ncbi:MAG: thioredoxin family protein, partial [Kiritimatiellia bacterium]|nr:thioredoxin family protein [Kiritimatiellia bacterium]
EFHDVWKNPDVAEQYGVTTIPTTVFIDSTGQERHRQVGVMTAEEILAKWAEVGVTLSPADSPSSLEP